jgi:hypothetical protein
MTDTELIDAFVGEFTRGEPLMLFRRSIRGAMADDVVPLLIEPWHDEDKEIDEWAKWRPLRIRTSRAALETLYERVPGPLPPLYEQSILSCHWGEVDLDEFRLLPNFPPPLDGLVSVLRADSVTFRALSSQGLVQFGMGPDVDYDTVCFDLNRRVADGDCAVVKVDHEEILIHERLCVVGVLAPSFRELVHRTLASRNPAA